MNFLFVGSLNGVELIILSSIYLIFLFFIIYQIFKNESGIYVIFWIIFSLFFPFIGPLIYFIKVIGKKKLNKSPEI